MLTVSVQEMEDSLTGSAGLDAKRADRFLQAIAGSLEYQLAHDKTSRLEPVKISVEEPVLTLGVLPADVLVDSTVAGTGLSQGRVKEYLSVLDKLLRTRIEDLRGPILLEGFGTLERKDHELYFRPSTTP